MLPQIGQPAPQFEQLSATGETLRLADFIGQYVIVYFYPKDMTPSCTTEACDFRDKHEEFQDLNTALIGISTDSAATHTKFIAKYGLPYHLLSDVDHEVAERYGVWVLKKNYGREYMGIERSTFLIGKDGTLLKEWRKVRVKGHVEAALAYLKEHQEQESELKNLS